MNHARTFATREAAEGHKLFRAGGLVAVWHEPCHGWHHEPARRQVTDTGPRASVRAAVLARDGHACVCCGVSVTGRRYSLQHRLRRSQGGLSVMSNLIVMLGDGVSGCHQRADSRRDPADEARGYTVRSGLDPRLVPVTYRQGDGTEAVWWLADDGSLLPESPELVAAS